MSVVTYAAFSYIVTAVISLILACLIVVLNRFIGSSEEEVPE